MGLLVLRRQLGMFYGLRRITIEIEHLVGQRATVYGEFALLQPVIEFDNSSHVHFG